MGSICFKREKGAKRSLFRNNLICRASNSAYKSRHHSLAPNMTLCLSGGRDAKHAQNDAAGRWDRAGCALTDSWVCSAPPAPKQCRDISRACPCPAPPWASPSAFSDPRFRRHRPPAVRLSAAAEGLALATRIRKWCAGAVVNHWWWFFLWNFWH